MRLRRTLRVFLAAAVLLGAGAARLSAQSITSYPIVGYADRWSVQPGETLKVMVSSARPTYRADLVKLIHGDMNPIGPGFKETTLPSALAGKEYPGRYQALPLGSYVLVPDSPVLARTGSFTLTAWIAPSTPNKAAQGILTKWSESDRRGYAMVVDGDGSLGLWIGDTGQVEKVRTGKPLRASTPALVWAGGNQMTNTTDWYFVAASYDAGTGRVTLYQEPLATWPVEATRAEESRPVKLKVVGKSDAPFLIGALWAKRGANEQRTGGHFNGKIEAPKVFGRVLTRQEIDGLKRGAGPTDALAAWNFEVDISSRRVTDTGPNKLNGRTMNMPTRAMTGHNWSTRETDYKRAKGEYGAIYFHDDDLDDAAWKADFEFPVPADLKSGIYAIRLRAGNAQDHIPFFVRPKKGTATAKIAFLVPSFAYMAYANNRSGPELLSTYARHSDGSGVAYSSRLRPVLSVRPGNVGVDPVSGLRNPGGGGGFNSDLSLIDWLETKKFSYDVITDEDLHSEGTSVLKPYKVILTGAHPEYWSTAMLDGMKAYLEGGGRLMYMGGNGFYWVTVMDPEDKHTVEIRRRDGTETWEAAPGEYFHSYTGEFGGLWRFRGRPPQAMVGVGFTAQGAPGRPYKRTPASHDPRLSWVFDGIGPDEPIGDFPSLTHGYGAGGFELDRLDYVLGSPPNAVVVASATDFGDHMHHVVEEVIQSDSKQHGPVNPWVKADMVYLDYPNGGAVFTTGSISWYGSLFYNGYNNNVSRLQENVLKRFASDEPLVAPTAK